MVADVLVIAVLATSLPRERVSPRARRSTI
jgi:hypothetical protein